jgi:putative membrane protein
MKTLICFLSGLMILFLAASCANNKPGKNYNDVVDESTSTFIKQGLEAGQTEIKASKIAEVNSKNPRVINFAKTMITDHDLAGDRLEKIAINNKIRGGDSISTDHQQFISKINALNGNAFDKAYINMMVTEHQNAIKLYTTASTDRMDDIQRFAKRTLIVLKTHLDSANNIATALK